MSFDAFELAQETGRPAELYDFRIGGDSFKLTSWAVNVTIPALGTFEAETVLRSAITKEATGEEPDLNITIPADSPFVLAYQKESVPGKRSTMILFRTHIDDPAQETIVFYKGAVATVTFSKDGREASVLVVSAMKAQSQEMPRSTYQGLCNRSLYDNQCQISDVDPDFQKFLNVSAVSVDGLVLTVDSAGSFGADFFEAGFIEFAGEPRMVVAQGGAGNNDLTIRVPFESSPLSQTVRVLAGCKHRVLTDCFTKFNNTDNFGGFPFVPLKDIFRNGLD